MTELQLNVQTYRDQRSSELTGKFDQYIKLQKICLNGIRQEESE